MLQPQGSIALTEDFTSPHVYPWWFYFCFSVLMNLELKATFPRTVFSHVFWHTWVMTSVFMCNTSLTSTMCKTRDEVLEWGELSLQVIDSASVALFSLCELPISPHWMVPKPTEVFLMITAYFWHEHFCRQRIVTASSPINNSADKNERKVSGEENEKQPSVQVTQLQPVSNQISTTVCLLGLITIEY